jgi:hypothetical protein
VVDPTPQPDLLQRADRPLPALTRVGHRQLDVADRRRPRDQVERLEDEPDLAVAHERLPTLVEPPRVDAVEEVTAAGGACSSTTGRTDPELCRP